MESAILVADATTVKMLLLWSKVLNRMSFSTTTLAFPDFEGKVMKHPERKMITAAGLLGHTLPLPTTFRKELETRNKRQEGPLREAVSRAISHSLATAQQYYQAPTMSDAYMAYGVMQDIAGTRGLSPPAPPTAVLQKEAPAEEEEEKEEKEDCGEENRGAKGKGKRKRTTSGKEEEGVPRKRKGFTLRQENVISTYFEQHISKRDFPTSLECRGFIKLYPEFASRKPKDIYDKCRNLAGR